MRTPEEIKKGLQSCSDVTHGQDCRKCAYRKGATMCIEELMADALVYINYLEEHAEAFVEMVPKWISVADERKPRHGEECICACEIDGRKILFILTWNSGGNNGYINEPHFSDEGVCGMRVTHWMPLPELTKED